MFKVTFDLCGAVSTCLVEAANLTRALRLFREEHEHCVVYSVAAM